MDTLLDSDTLERSDVVANAAMNRARGITGANSYTKDLAFDPVAFLKGRLETQAQVSWLDLCCGTGKALVEGAQGFEKAGLSSRINLLGIDLVDMFYPHPARWGFLRLEAVSLSHWNTTSAFDLITCVHGLHYIGDKLSLLQRAV